MYCKYVLGQRHLGFFLICKNHDKPWTTPVRDSYLASVVGWCSREVDFVKTEANAESKTKAFINAGVFVMQMFIYYFSRKTLRRVALINHSNCTESAA